MNRNYRLIWSHHLNSIVAVAENTRGRGKSGSRTTVLAGAVASAMLSLTAPMASADSCTTATTTVPGGNTVAQCVLDTGQSLTVNSGGTVSDVGTAVAVHTGTVAGAIRNSGSIVSTAAPGIRIDAGTLTGGIQNTGGTITAGSTGVLIAGGVVQSGFVNSGTISGNSRGVYFDGLHAIVSLSGGITNSGLILNGGYSSDDAALEFHLATVTGGITNSATIGAYGSTSNLVGIQLSASTLAGSITNSGLIEGATGSEAGFGIRIYRSQTDGITNSGTIRGLGTGSSPAGIFLTSSTMNGSIVNSGQIIGAEHGASGLGSTGVGILLESSSISGSIINSGTIAGGYAGIYLHGSGAIVNTDISNFGTISGGDYGLYVTSGTVGGAIQNAGLISGGSKGLYIWSGTVAGSLQNSGTISGGATGVRVRGGSAYVGDLTNSGTISGGTYAINADSITLANLAITGSTSKLLGDVKAVGTDVVVKTGATFGNTNAFDVNSFTVESGGLFNFGTGPRIGLATDGVKVANGFANAGIVSVAAGVTPTITGDYAQTGTYRMGLTGTTPGNYGVLNVTGTANVAGSVNVVISGAPAIANGTTVAGVIHSTGAMTVTPANITVTDNNLFYNFTAATVTNPGHDLDLIIAADTNALPNAVGPNGPATGVAQALQDIYNGGVPAGFQPVFDAMGAMTPTQLNSALLQLVPSLQGASAQAGVSALHSMNKIIQSRVESVQGLNSGDETADQYAWARVFGNWGDQNDHKGVPGFESSTRGLALGMDKPITDRIRAGGLVTYANSDLKSNLGSSKVNVDTYEIAGYGSYNIDPQTDINVQLDLGLNKANSDRHIFLGTTAKGDFDSFNYHLSAGIGHLFQLTDKTNFTPSARMDYTHVKTDGYTETGAGVLNLHVDGSTYEEFLLTADAKLSHKLTENGLKLVANGSVGYDFINKQAQSTSTFTGGGPSFVTNGLDVSPWVYRGGLGLVKETGSGLEFSARYDAEGRTSGYLNQTASVKVRWAF